jgi:alkylation response protein AidB-like acyl-CoA dehydrogenase
VSLRCLAAAAVSLSLLVGADVASARTLSTKAALKKTGQIARKAARDTGGVYWFAGACRRATRKKVSCWGGVAYADETGCIQKVVVTRRGKRISGRRTGRTYCGDLPGGGSGNSGTGGGSGSPAICAIRQSVCI